MKKDFLSIFLSSIERVGNALPHPATLFLIFALLIVIISNIATNMGLSAVHPADGSAVVPYNLMSIPGLHKILTQMVYNFTSFAPLGTVLVAMLGIGIAESSGLISTSIKQIVANSHRILIGIVVLGCAIALFSTGFGLYLSIGIIAGAILSILLILLVKKKSPNVILTFTIIFAGVMSNTASEVGYVLLVPLGGIMFAGAGRHPIGGLAAAFAGVSGGYSANLLLGTIDPLLAGISTEAARIVSPEYSVNAAANYYFMAVSTFLVAFAGTWVTEKIVLPRLGEYKADFVYENSNTNNDENLSTDISKKDRRGLFFAITVLLILGTIVFMGTYPSDGFLRNPANGDLLKSPFMDGIVAFIFIAGGLSGVAYGIGAGTFKNDGQVMAGMGKAMETLGIYIVLVFFAAQFVAYFKWSNLGLIMAINGAELLQSTQLGPIPLLIAFIILSAIINLIMGSASAKWAIMAPVFIPMFFLLGMSPELVQGAYRVGDSITNIISPMMSYFALIVAFLAKYDKNAGIGTVIATMLPYSFVFFIVWTIFFIIWFALGLPLGPDSPLMLN